MSLWILNNANCDFVATDLKTICKDPALNIQIGTSLDGTRRGTGEVSFYPAPTLSSVGCQMLTQLINSSANIVIRGEADDWSFAPRPLPGTQLASILGNTAGATLSDTFPNPNPTLIEVAYTVQNNSGYGFWVLDANGNHIPYPTDVMLFHELAHANNFLIAQGPIDVNNAEKYAVLQENQYRASQKISQRVGHEGGPNRVPSSPPPSSKCFIATAACGSPLAPEVQVLRSVRDDFLRQTSAGERFFNRYWDVYYRLSPLVVRAMNNDPEIRELVRWSVVTPLVHYYELLLDFPDQRLEEVIEPWRSFLAKLRDELETWASVIELPRNLANGDPVSNARELAIVLRYILRSEDKRSDYLTELERGCQIPLKGEPEQLREAERELRRHQCPTQEIERILGLRINASSVPVLLGVAYTEVYSILPSLDRLYSVRITNLSNTAFQQIALFYDQTDKPGAVISLFENDIQPNQVVTLVLGTCNLLYRYNVGVFDYQNTMIASIPDSNDAFWQGLTTMTPASARQFQAQIGNADPCLDVWLIEAQDIVRP